MRTNLTANYRPQQRPTPPHPTGGQHRAQQGLTTRHTLSGAEQDEDLRRRMDEFEAERQSIAAGHHIDAPF